MKIRITTPSASVNGGSAPSTSTGVASCFEDGCGGGGGGGGGGGAGHWTRQERRLWSAVLFGSTAALYAARLALPVAMVEIADDMGWNKAEQGSVLSGFFYGYSITQLVSGRVADLWGAERILPYSTAFWIVMMGFTGEFIDAAVNWTPWPLAALVFVRIFQGIGKEFAIAIFDLSLPSRSATTAILGSFLMHVYGWRTLFHVIGLIGAFWWLLLLLIIQTTSQDVISRKNFALLTEDQPLLLSPTTTASIPPLDWSKLLRHNAFWAAVVAYYSGSNAYFSLFNWSPSFFADRFPEAQGILYNGVPALAIVCTSTLAPMVASTMVSEGGRSVRFTRLFMECFSLVGLAVCLLGAAMTSDLCVALLAISLAMAARGAHHAGAAVNPHDLAPMHTGQVFGLFNFFGSATGFVGVYVAGSVLEATNNNWSAVFALTSAQCLIGALVYGLWGNVQRIV